MKNRGALFVETHAASLLLGFVVSLGVWLLLSIGPLQGSKLATIDLTRDTVFGLGADDQPRDGPPLYLVGFRQEDWLAAGSPEETPPEAVARMLVFAQHSGAVLAVLDIDLSARRSANAGRVEPRIETALRNWEADSNAPFLVLTDSLRSGRKTGPAYFA